MATRRVNIIDWSTKPDDSGEVYLEPYNVRATNDVWKHHVVIFEDGSTRTGLYGTFQVPQGYVDTANLIIIWTTVATTGDVEWDFDYRAVGGDDTESFDQTGTQESVNINDTAPSASHERMVATVSLSDANFSPGDLVEFFFARDKSDAGDTISDATILFGLFLEYSDA